MKRQDGRKHYGSLMNAYNKIWQNTPEYRRSNLGSCNNRYHKTLNDRLHHLITTQFDEDDINIVASWYVNYHVDKLEKLGYNIRYWDKDPYVCEDCNVVAKINNTDIIFESANFNSYPIIHKYCEDTYPIGRVHKGKFLLAGCNKKRLHICNPIESCQQLIEQNNIKDVIHTEEYELHQTKTFFVIGTN